jgi:chromosomal replication initiator protein
MSDVSFPIGHFVSKSNAAILNNPTNLTQATQLNITPSMSEASLLNQEIMDMLKNLVGDEKFTTYFAKTFKILEINSKTVICLASTSFIKKVIEHQYVEHIKQAIKNCLGKDYELDIKVDSENSASAVYHPSINSNSINNFSEEAVFDEYQIQKGKTVKETSFVLSDAVIPAHPAAIDQRIVANNENQQIDPKKHFDAFVVGPSNNLAHASAFAVAKNPGQIYQALYLYGNSGLGKTHLLHAIGNYIIEQNPNQRICLTTATEFMSEMIHAIQEKAVPNFRKKYYENIDVLLIDDIHELKNREGTQNEFFHIFNELQRRKKQLVFTSDKDPKEITGIEDRIKTRLSSALVVEIQQPDLETRIAILKKKAIDKDIYLPDDVVNLIASCIKNNIRELEGSLIKLGAYSSIFKVDIDLQTAKEQLRISDTDQEKTVNIESIAKSVSQYYKIPVPDLKSKTRSKEITIARHIAMYMAYYMAKATLAEIGNYFGKRDHTSVIHAVNKIKSLQKTDQSISKSLYEIECTL